MMESSRLTEIFTEEMQIRGRRRRFNQRLNPADLKRLTELADEAAQIRNGSIPTVVPVGGVHAPKPRDPNTLPASMRPGARHLGD